MPCDIGYKSYVKVRIPTPNPQEFKSKVEVPKVDADLLEKLGVDDPEFLAWLEELDNKPLLDEALKRALGKISGAEKLKFAVTADGYLEASALYTTGAGKKKFEKIAALVASQFQMETLGIVAALLDYEVRAETNGENIWTLEGEKNESASVHKYLRVVKGPGEDSEIEFEHFDTAESRDKEMSKFFALAQKLGVRLRVMKTKKSGRSIPAGVVHHDFLKNRS